MIETAFKPALLRGPERVQSHVVSVISRHLVLLVLSPNATIACQIRLAI